MVWDNRCISHRARPYDYSQTRTVRGTRIAGDPITEAALDATPTEDTKQQLVAEMVRVRKRWQQHQEQLQAKMDLGAVRTKGSLFLPQARDSSEALFPPCFMPRAPSGRVGSAL